jgi:hypothetical protein
VGHEMLAVQKNLLSAIQDIAFQLKEIVAIQKIKLGIDPGVSVADAVVVTSPLPQP